MYGKFLLALGIAFILFVFFMFVGYLFRSGFSGILKALFIRFLIVFSAVTSGIFVGIFLYSLFTGNQTIETIRLLSAFLQDELSSLW